MRQVVCDVCATRHPEFDPDRAYQEHLAQLAPSIRPLREIHHGHWPHVRLDQAFAHHPPVPALTPPYVTIYVGVDADPLSDRFDVCTEKCVDIARAAIRAAVATVPPMTKVE
jgi:hypothetical protein